MIFNSAVGLIGCLQAWGVFYRYEIRWMVAKSCTTLDGWNPINNGMFTTYQLVPDFFHPQYHDYSYLKQNDNLAPKVISKSYHQIIQHWRGSSGPFP